jgi:hypothetical protein
MDAIMVIRCIFCLALGNGAAVVSLLLNRQSKEEKDAKLEHFDS